MPHPAVSPPPDSPEASIVAPRGSPPPPNTSPNHIPPQLTVGVGGTNSPSPKSSNIPFFAQNFIHSTNVLCPFQPSPQGASRSEEVDLDRHPSPRVGGKYRAGEEWCKHYKEAYREVIAGVLNDK